MKIYQVTIVPLAANAAFTSDWFSNPLNATQVAAQFVRVTAYSDVPGMVAIQQCDDTSQTKLITTSVPQPVSGGAPSVLQAAVMAQNWRYVYTNGVTAQTQFQLIAAHSADLSPAILLELQRINLQLMAMRAQRDVARDDSYQAVQ